MAITFKTKANGDITMLDANAKQVLSMIGKTYGERGVITAGEASAAAARLRAANEAATRSNEPAGDSEDNDAGGDTVPMRTRTQPFIEMLENAAKNGKDILWGV
jgi:cyclopropane-fatty-acyl-phospholipid synthase